MLDKTLQTISNVDAAEQLRSYIETTLHQSVQIKSWRGASGLPVFLSKRYDFFTGLIAGQACLFAFDRYVISATPKEITKHIRHIGLAYDGVVVYVAPNLSADRRSRLVAKGVAFIVPRNQLYIPQLALELREYFRASSRHNPEQLAPASQAILFHHLLRPGQPDNALRDTYSAMTISRAYDELRRLGLVSIRKQGRLNSIESVGESRDLLKMAAPYLRSPVRNRLHLGTCTLQSDLMQAGETALAALTDLSPPPIPVYAFHHKAGRSIIARDGLPVVNDADEAVAMFELWDYDPAILADADLVDRLSLYAQFRNYPDARVAGAAEALLEQVA